jgi:dolichol-phosphate mannosyltransferase
MKTLSVITAFLNEESNLPLFRERVMAALHALPYDYEIVLVDDHSTDGSSRLAKAWVNSDPRVRYIRLSRNFGSHAALAAGLATCAGDAAIFLAADLQDPPEVIAQLAERWEAGHDVVWAVRAERRGESRATKITAWLYYRLMRTFAIREMPATGADFMLLDRKVVDAYNSVREKNTAFLPMIVWLGFRQTSITYVKQARHSGVTKWNLSKKIKFAIDSLVSFSYFPIRFASVSGVCISFLGACYAVVVIVYALLGIPVQGWSSLMVVVLVLGGFQLLMLGTFGEYLWRTFDEARGRPRYIIEEHIPPAAAKLPVGRQESDRDGSE